MTLTCNHQRALGLQGLCPQCQADYDEDPGAWLEFGPHPTGDKNTAALDAEMEIIRDE